MDSARSVKCAGAFEKRLDERHRFRSDCDESLLEELLSFLERVDEDEDDEGIRPKMLRRNDVLRLRLLAGAVGSIVD